MYLSRLLIITTDDVRRSGRATKGQHTKNIDEPEAPAPKRGKAGRPSKASKQVSTPPEEEVEKEEPAIIRCICGYVVEDEDDERTMVICDNCSAWQHNICMGISEDPDDLPEQYFCEQCRPEDHKELLDAVARGETPWVEREAQRQREEQEKKGRKRKGGKRGKKAKNLEAKAEKPKEPNGTNTPIPTQPLPQEVNTPIQPEISQKRKLPEELDMHEAALNELVSQDKLNIVHMLTFCSSRQARYGKCLHPRT